MVNAYGPDSLFWSFHINWYVSVLFTAKCNIVIKLKSNHSLLPWQQFLWPETLHSVIIRTRLRYSKPPVSTEPKMPSKEEVLN